MLRSKRNIQTALVALVILIVALLFIYKLLPAEEDEIHFFMDQAMWKCKDDGTLLKAFDSVYCFRNRNVFFIETTHARRLNKRQACAIESAARHNPSYNIKVLLTTSRPIDVKNNLTRIIANISNVQIISVDIWDVVYGTPLWAWYTADVWWKSKYKFSHLSDAVRLLLVWRYGGMYLDLDTVVLRSMEQLRNTTIFENGANSGSAIMIFDKAHPFLRKCIIDYATKYDPWHFSENGPALMTRNIKSFCNINELSEIHRANCDIDVLPMEKGYPIPYENWEEYFNPWANSTASFNNSYLIHVWNKLSKKKILRIGLNSLYELAMKDNCPAVYAYAQRFALVQEQESVLNLDYDA